MTNADITTQGAIIGPGVFSSLKMKFPNIAIQGVEYGAGLMTNMLPGGAEYAGINTAKGLFNSAAQACPQSKLVGGGYSQGAALMHRAIESLPQATKDRIAAVVLYGDTQNLQDGGKIKNFPKEKVKVRKRILIVVFCTVLTPSRFSATCPTVSAAACSSSTLATCHTPATTARAPTSLSRGSRLRLRMYTVILIGQYFCVLTRPG